MTSSVDKFCRPKRSFSISPSVSFDNSVLLTEEERKEKRFYGAPIKDMTNEIFLAFDDIIKHINHNLVIHLRAILKGDTMTNDEIDILIHKFLDLTFKEFTFSFDKAEIKSQKFFSLEEMDKDICNYLTLKNKNNLSPFQINTTTTTTTSNVDKNISNLFDKEKEKYFNNLRENLKVQLELDLEKKIAENLTKNNTFIKESIKTIKNEMESTTDFSKLDRNLDIMMEEFTKMKNELDGF